MKQKYTLTHKHVPANIFADVLPASVRLCCSLNGSGVAAIQKALVQSPDHANLTLPPNLHLQCTNLVLVIFTRSRCDRPSVCQCEQANANV